MVPGHCPHKGHDRANLGLGGRRVLVSRLWSGKTLAAHRADRAAVVRAALEEAGIDPDDHDELSAVGSDGRWSWELLGRNRVDAPTYAAAIAQAITTRQRWHREYETAKTAAAARAGRAPTGSGMSSAVRQRSDGGMTVEESRELLRVEEAAEVMGMSARHVRRLVAERQIAFHKLGRSVRIGRADIVAYIEASRVEPITASDVWRNLRRVG